MSKSSFINKKALLIIFIVVLVIAGGVGLYFLLRPKVDLDAPYNNFYSYSVNEDVKTVTNQKQQIYNSLLYYTNFSYFSYEEQEQKQKFYDIQNRYDCIFSMENIYKQLNSEFLKNLPFTKDNDKKMLKTQQNMSKSYKNLTEYANDCISFYNTYWAQNSTTDLNYYHIINIINNYNNIYYKYIDELSNFYTYACQIFAHYLTPSYQVNRLSLYFYTTIAGWQDNILASVCGENYDYDQNNLSIQDLSKFVTSYIDTKTYYNSQTTFDELLNNFDEVDINLCTEKLATNSYVGFVNEQQTDELKNKLSTLGKQFFLVIT